MAEPITGIGGDVTTTAGTIGHVRNWKVDREADNKAYASSDTAGWKKTAEGNKGWKGSMEVFAEAGALSVKATNWTEGKKVQLDLVVDATHKLSGQARIDTINADVNIEDSELVGMTINFTGDGAYTLTPAGS